FPDDFLTKCRLITAEGGTNGAIRQESSLQGEEGDAREKARYAEVGALGEEGDEPEAGDRDRAFRGSPRGRKGSEQTEEPEQEEEVSRLPSAAHAERERLSPPVRATTLPRPALDAMR